MFLFHQTFEGQKVGTLIDFGGAVEEGEEITYAAAREWAEETLGLFSYEYSKEQEKDIITKCTQDTLQQLQDPSIPHIDTQYDYHILFPNRPYNNLLVVNDVFSHHTKKRKFVWVSVRDLLDRTTCLPLFARLVVVNKEIEEVARKLIADNS